MKASEMLKAISTALVIGLILLALWVYIGEAQLKDMWLPIALYWLVLAVKNLCDYFSSFLAKRCAKESKNHGM